MGENKKYYWLKLKEDFFNQKEIKKLRKIAGGDTYTIIYLKLQLLSLKNDGVLIFEGVESNFEEEIALDLDEEVDNVRMTLAYLNAHKMIEELNETEYMLPKTVENIGSETQVAERVRKFRERKALQCNTFVTSGNTEIEIEKDIEKEKKIDKGNTPTKFIPPTLEEVKAYCKERNNNVNADKFIDFYQCKGWMVGKNKMKDWEAAVRNWESGNKPQQQTQHKSNATNQGSKREYSTEELEDMTYNKKTIVLVDSCTQCVTYRNGKCMIGKTSSECENIRR